MKIVQKEVHDYFTGQNFYEFEKSGQVEYQIYLVEGFSGDVMHTFVQNTDYELFNDGIQWLNGDVPEDPPASLGLDKTTFIISYSYEDTPARGMDLSIHPFVKGLTFEKIWSNKVEAIFGKTPVYFASLDDLIEMKRAAGRPQDLEDLKYLKKLKEKGKIAE